MMMMMIKTHKVDKLKDALHTAWKLEIKLDTHKLIRRLGRSKSKNNSRAARRTRLFFDEHFWFYYMIMNIAFCKLRCLFFCFLWASLRETLIVILLYMYDLDSLGVISTILSHRSTQGAAGVIFVVQRFLQNNAGPGVRSVRHVGRDNQLIVHLWNHDSTFF